MVRSAGLYQRTRRLQPPRVPIIRKRRTIPSRIPVFAHSDNELYIQRLAPVDLLQIIMQGDGAIYGGKPLQIPQTSIEAQIRRLLLLRGNPPYTRLLEALVKDLEDNKVDGNAAIENNISSRSTAPLSKESQLQQALRTASKLGEVVRIVTTALASVEGRQALEQHNQDLVEAVSSFHNRNLESPLLQAINNIACGFRRHSLPLGRDLCILGMELSIKSQRAAAMRQYLLDCHANRYDIPHGAWKFLLRLLVHHSTFRRPRAEHRRGAWLRHDALRLLTGWKTAGIDDPQEKREVCILDCISPDDQLSFRVYIQALGAFGASESLWRLWVQRPAKYDPSIRASYPLCRVYLEAFIQAGDPQRAIQIIMESGIPPSALGLSLWRDLCILDRRHHLGYTNDPSVLGRLLSSEVQGSFFESMGIGSGKQVMHYLLLLEDALNVCWVPPKPAGLKILPPKEGPFGKVRLDILKPRQVSWVPGGDQGGVHIRKG